MALLDAMLSSSRIEVILLVLPILKVVRVETPETLTLSNSVWPSISTWPLASIAPANVDTPVMLKLVAVSPLETTTLLGNPIVTLLPEPAVSISFAVPTIPRTSLSRSIESAPPVSAWKSRSDAVTCASTYALIDCWVAKALTSLDAILSSSRIISILLALPILRSVNVDIPLTFKLVVLVTPIIWTPSIEVLKRFTLSK